MLGENFATKQFVETLHATSAQQPKPVPMNAMHCNGQRGENKTEDDTCRPKIKYIELQCIYINIETRQALSNESK